MIKTSKLPIWLTLLLAFAVIAPPEDASAMTAEQYLTDGNRLYRDDLYWAALLRYRQAADEGLDTPLLHYNMGIAHYRAGQHLRARESFLLALNGPSLRVAARYNLGLNAYELGQTDEALRWFRLARDQNSSTTLQGFAVIAISRIRDEQARPDEFEVRVAERKRDFTNLDLHARVSFGSDDNVFRSPGQPYVDFSDPATPVVIPEIKSGAFMPISLSAKYLVNSLKFEGFYVAYRLGGRYYQDKGLENGNEYQHEVSFGSQYRQTKNERTREVQSAFKVAQHDETYYDPDDGGERNINGVFIDDRMNYLRYGPELTLRQSGKRIAFGLKIKGQLWNYDEQVLVPEYDHEYFLLSLYGQYKFTQSSLFRVSAEGYSRRFGDRPAFDLDGQQRVGNPNIRYDYYSLKLTARQRLFDFLWFGMDAQRTERTDQYVGYGDYTLDSFGFEIHLTPGGRFDLEFNGRYQLYNYPNAFAFHEPTAGRKTRESAQARLVGTYQMTRHLSLVAEARYRETVSNDTRIQYERRQYIFGVRWEQ